MWEHLVSQTEAPSPGSFDFLVPLLGYDRPNSGAPMTQMRNPDGSHLKEKSKVTMSHTLVLSPRFDCVE